MTRKSQKELAFLHDLYIDTDWGERFAELVDEHVELPKEGRALYVESGTGGHALALQERAGEKFKLVCVDQNEESLEVARAKAVTLGSKAQFRRDVPEALSFSDNEFDLVLGNASFILPADLKSFVIELVRVTKPGGTIAWWLPTASSFGEFFSIYWEALLNADIADHSPDVERLIATLPTVTEAEVLTEDMGVQDITSLTRHEEFDFESGEQFLGSPLINDFLLPNWLKSIPEEAQARVMQELARLIDEERHQSEFPLSVKATLIAGKKAHLQ